MASKKRKPKNVWKPVEAFWTAERLVRDSALIVPEIERRYREAHPYGEGPDDADVRSWRVSVYEAANVLVANGLGGVYMFIEYRVQPDMAPIDVVLAGRHPNGMLSYAAIELKQWSAVGPPDGTNPIGIKSCVHCDLLGAGRLCRTCAVAWVWAPGYNKHKKHPSAQAYDNLLNLRRYHSMFDDRYVNLVAAAYLHNLRDEHAVKTVIGVRPNPGVNVPVFTGRDPNGLRNFITEHFAAEPGAEAAEALLKGRRSAGRISDDLGEIVAGMASFGLVEQQAKAVDAVMAEVMTAEPRSRKKVFVIEGRPGTGKSLVALTLLGRANVSVPPVDARYVSGGVSSRETFKRASSPYRDAFIPLIQVADWEEDEVDMILCDEAHRLSARPKTGSFAMRKGPESSVEIAVRAARVPVFFIDGDQRLFGDEVWTPARLKEEILNLGAEIVPFTLDRVLRSMGSATYDTWLRHLLYGKPIVWRRDADKTPEPFELYYAESPHEMEKFLESKLKEGRTARMTAGICWDWLDDTGTVPEVKLPGGWARPWNPGDNPKTAGVPKRHFWATDQGGFAQIGCVHTAQGLEYEWGGVIIGPDLTRDGDQWLVHREHVLNKANRITDDAELHRAVRNAYGVLMTRSLRGTVLYSVDPETRELFAALGVERVPRV